MNRNWTRTHILLAAILLFLLPAAFLIAEGGEQLFWVQYNQETKAKKLSNGRPAPANAIPGQFYEWEKGRLEQESQWRSPLDVIYEYKEAKEGRVVFSHERHFSLTGEKSCSKCHDDSVGLGDKGIVRKSFAATVAAEAHGEKSLGRFCATCHNGETEIGELSKTVPASISPSTKIFTANHTSSKNDCNRCHTPRDHGADYTSRHGEDAEHGRGSSCVECHRGADRITREQRNMAMAFRDAQLRLVTDPENETLFQKTLPPVFCAYCHNRDDKAWEGEERGERENYHRSSRERSDENRSTGRYRERDDD